MSDIIFREGDWGLSDDGGPPYLVGGKCCQCGLVVYPRSWVCPTCLAVDEMERIQLSSRGKLYAFSIIRAGAPPGFELPYAVGYVDLPEGVRVFAQLDNWQDGRAHIGGEVELVAGILRTDEQGNPIIGYKFRPVH